MASLPPWAWRPLRGGPDLFHVAPLAGAAHLGGERAAHEERKKQSPPGQWPHLPSPGPGSYKLQRGVLQVELAGGGDDLNAVDEVHDGVAAQDLAGGCRGGNTGSAGGRPPHLQRLIGWVVLFFGKDKGNQQSPPRNRAGRTESTLRISTRPESQHGRPGSKGLPDTFTAHLVLFHRERQRLKLCAEHSS